MLQKLILAWLAVVLCALHAQPSPSHFQLAPAHRQTAVTSNPAFEGQFNAITAEVDLILKAVPQQNSALYAPFLPKLQAIRTSAAGLRQTLTQYGLQIVNGIQQCPKISTFNRTDIRLSISRLENSEREGLDYLTGRTQCEFARPGLNRILGLTTGYVGFVNQTLDGGFCVVEKVLGEKAVGLVNINTSFYKSNLKAPNWYFGSTTASDYKITMFKRSIAYNLTDCPLQTPFVDKTFEKCINCPEGGMYNVGSQSCDTCKPDEILNIAKGICDRCEGEKKLVDKNYVCVPCLIEQNKIFNITTGRCDVCVGKVYLDVKSKTCVSTDCPKTAPRFNRDMLRCQACGVSEQVDPNDITKCIKTNYIGLCRPDQPRYDFEAKACVACPFGTVYNSGINLCQQVVSHFTAMNHDLGFDWDVYDIKLDKNKPYATNYPTTSVFPITPTKDNKVSNPIPVTPITPITPPKAIVPDNNKAPAAPNAINNEKPASPVGVSAVAPTPTPVVAKAPAPAPAVPKPAVAVAAVAKPTAPAPLPVPSAVQSSAVAAPIPKCMEHQVYNQTQQMCVAINKNCEPGFVFVVRLKRCHPVNSSCNENQYFSRKAKKCLAISASCKRDQFYNSTQKMCLPIDKTCPAGFSFDEGSLRCKKVVVCKPDERLNARWQFCEKKPLKCHKGQTLDAKTNTCVDHKFTTNPYLEKLSYVGNFKNYVSYYYTVKKMNKSIQDCPLSTPFYQRSTDSCISCPKETPIFDLTNDRCIACKYNEFYNQFQHKCMDEKLRGSVSSTVGRMGL